LRTIDGHVVGVFSSSARPAAASWSTRSALSLKCLLYVFLVETNLFVNSRDLSCKLDRLFKLVGQLPRYTNSTLVRLFKQICPAYEELATSFSTRSLDDLHKVGENHAEAFIKDGNMGLVKQAIQALTKQNIQRLTKTYLTLSSASIADQVHLSNPAETERRVFKMIQDGEVFAKINQKDGMVEFYENPEQFNDNGTLDYLDKQLQNTIHLTTQVSAIDEQIGLDQKYIQKTLQAERGPGGPGSRGWPGGAGEDDDMGMAVDGAQAGPGGFRG